MKIKILKQFNNYTIFDFLETYHISKHLINEWFNRKVVLINENICNSNAIIYENDIVELLIDEKNNIIPYDMKLDILYEDDDILVVNKPQGILIYSDGNDNNTLLNAVYNYLYKNKKIPYAYPVHRIDYDTTGIVIFAKNKLALSYLSVEIENHNLLKEYVCLCHNKFKKQTGIINSRIGKNRHNNYQVISKTGKEAETYYEVINNDDVSKVKVIIKHGRKHQIRVHLNSINHPIVGDKIYGIDDNETLKLHFKKVVFTHPYTRKQMTINCEETF